MDSAANFAKVTLSTGYSSAVTSVVLSGGDGAKLPVAPFNATWWNSTDFSDPTDDPNREIVRVTVIATDTLTITRGQESTSAANHNTAGKTYKMIAGLTAKTINTDIPALLPVFIDSEIVPGSGTAFVLVNTPVVGTVHLFGPGIRLYPGSDPAVGYAISGKNITTQQSFNIGDLIADYRTN